MGLQELCKTCMLWTNIQPTPSSDTNLYHHQTFCVLTRPRSSPPCRFESPRVTTIRLCLSCRSSEAHYADLNPVISNEVTEAKYRKTSWSPSWSEVGLTDWATSPVNCATILACCKHIPHMHFPCQLSRWQIVFHRRDFQVVKINSNMTRKRSQGVWARNWVR